MLDVKFNENWEPWKGEIYVATGEARSKYIRKL